MVLESDSSLILLLASVTASFGNVNFRNMNIPDTNGTETFTRINQKQINIYDLAKFF